MKVTATIEARMGATRLPGKVMLPFGGLPMLQRKIERVARCRTVNAIKVLTTINPVNQIIEDMCHRIDCPVFRGSEEDVLDRVLQGTADENPDIIVQLTGDNPLIDPDLIDQTVQHLIDHNLDLASNSLTQRVLIGLNVRCFKRKALQRADQLCKDPMIRVHGGYYIQLHPDDFKIGEPPVDPRYIVSDIRLTVDEPRDYELARRVFETLHATKPAFGADDILDLFARFPEWKKINASVQQKKPGEG
ncbi:MAG: glycosyltransferase family protein [Micavibrio aeruginosavorus]|uniref:Glycosyltransferase family protein n=1 Tax=Micavibrio aeruginosavorus TaxID=349221 RepID=A0A7T5UHU0_9BACT|nr:MAG: glycosyltransferase family protein [Micavibrio aeruginosavorus]